MKNKQKKNEMISGETKYEQISNNEYPVNARRRAIMSSGGLAGIMA